MEEAGEEANSDTKQLGSSSVPRWRAATPTHSDASGGSKHLRGQAEAARSAARTSRREACRVGVQWANERARGMAGGQELRHQGSWALLSATPSSLAGWRVDPLREPGLTGISCWRAISPLPQGRRVSTCLPGPAHGRVQKTLAEKALAVWQEEGTAGGRAGGPLGCSSTQELALVPGNLVSEWGGESVMPLGPHPCLYGFCQPMQPQGLQVRSIDWLRPRNNLRHHTAQIDTRRLLVRRGQAFDIRLHFLPRGYQPGVDSIYLIAETGPQPEQQSGTRAVFLLGLGQPTASGIWSAGYVANGPRSADVAVLAPARAPIGRYQLKIHVDSGYGRVASYLLGEFVLLFNAWCPEDDVYLASEPERQEYVMNEDGIIYQGNKDWILPSPWNYGQFEEDVVDICLKLLDRNLNYRRDPAKDSSLRGSAAYVSRVLSAIVNSNDDSGVLLGNWSEDYSGGVRPTAWSGSLAILRQWDRTGGQPVRYGQCWVFAAVMCTVMRGLGIPTRVVTNFNSGHDTDGNLIIDIFFDKTGQLLPRESKDSVWNFHVWNECWMARRDLPAGYGGWQVLDATPQERSNGLYCCGPAPVTAIREGDVQHRYDAPFVFSMVNADRVTWLLSGTRKEKLHLDEKSIGIHISTKRIGSQDREDITGAYKHREGSVEERRAFRKALAARAGEASGAPEAPGLETRFSTEAVGGNLASPMEGQLSLRLQLVESAEFGQDLHLRLLAQNLEVAHKEVKLSLSTQPVLHNGTPRPPFWQETHYLSLSPKEEKRISWRIAYGQYGKHLAEERQVQAIAIAEENTSWQKMLVEKTITMANPTLTLSVLAPVVVHQSFPLHVEFVNPLPQPAGGCVLVVEGSGLVKGQTLIELGSLGAQEKGGIKFQLTPYKSGPRQLHVTLTSSHFPPIKGWKQLEVAPHPGGS
uniref:protein-glutamine gamma-glutamyltransferase 5-like n=1 Tax=Euleptes europaea TaxID=460621 RepID=UPI0025422B59|nr:protein-glutamine gamma-glutamyltransferase 5-like [Euleptes europaea]